MKKVKNKNLFSYLLSESCLFIGAAFFLIIENPAARKPQDGGGRPGDGWTRNQANGLQF
ncbi:MAG: hypothetical protein PHQ74_05670 [Crocinitomicaceae bacterium]|nr:hypothetical protein [Crocinitomicaceae bacterium]